MEIEVVKDIVERKLMKDGKILKSGGKRFRLVEEIQKENEEMNGGVVHDGGEQEPNSEYLDRDQKDETLQETDEEDEPYIDTRIYLSDFSTLMLNALIYRMNKVLGFETMLIISKSGRHLYLLIRASTGDLKVHAQNQGYLLSLEVGYTDIETQPPFSLGKCSTY